MLVFGGWYLIGSYLCSTKVNHMEEGTEYPILFLLWIGILHSPHYAPSSVSKLFVIFVSRTFMLCGLNTSLPVITIYR